MPDSSSSPTSAPQGRFNRNAWIAITLLYLAVVGAWLFAVWPKIPSLLQSDALGYFKGARNLLRYGTLAENEAPPLDPISFRTPGYPCFLAMLFRLAGVGSTVPVLANAALLLASSWLGYFLAVRLGAGKWKSFAAALLIGLNPLALAAVPTLTTETLFTLNLLAALACWVSFRRNEQLRIGPLLGCAGAFGVLPLVRPIGLYPMVLFLIFLGGLALRTLIRRRRESIAWLLPAALLAAAPTLVWMARNHRTFGDFYFCELGAFNLRVYHGNEILLRAGAVKSSRFLEDFNHYFPMIYEPKRSPKRLQDQWERESLEIFRKYPATTLRVTLSNLSPVFAPGINAMTQTLGLEYKGLNGAPGALARGRPAEALRRLKAAGMANIALGSAAAAERILIWLVFLLFLVEMIPRRRPGLRDPRWLMGGAILLMLVLSLLSGGGATSRFRIPLWPGMVALALASPLPGCLQNRTRARNRYRNPAAL